MNKFLKLGKATIALPVTLTALLGYMMFQPALDWYLVSTLAGVFLLALGSGALNQVQERHTDALMKRTAGRPLPSGALFLQAALVFVVLTSAAGTFFLLLTGSLTAAALGLFTLAWYSLVYTPLKKRTAFAVLPGALIGALPPLIGWSAAGGKLPDMEILAVAFVLFLGQMPHYWLLLLKIGSEFEEAGLPSITALLDARQIRNLSYTWIAATGVSVMMLPVTPVIRHSLASVVLVIASVAFLVHMFYLSYHGNLISHWKKAFITVNLFYLTLILVLIADHIF
jgi:heme o synthase